MVRNLYFTRKKLYLDIVIPRQVEDIVEMMDSLLGRTKIVFAFDSQSWADPKVFSFLRLCASDAKVYCRRDGRQRNSIENDANAKDATYRGR